MEEDYSEHHNPYIAGKALRKDEDFFGREDIIRQVKMTLEGKQNNMVVLFGQRRIGKTSILNKLERLLANPPFVVVNFDLLDKAEKPITALLSELAVVCAQKAGMEFDGKDLFASNPNAFHETFLPTLYKKLGENKKLVLLFDEFDVLDETGKKLDETAAANAFHKYIRQLNVAQFNIYFVFVVGRRMEELGDKFLSTFKEASHIRVFVLNEKDAVALIRRGENEQIAFEKEAIDQILFYTRGHPYFIQLLCQEIFNHIFPESNMKKQIITRKIVEDSLHGAIEKGEGQFVWIWKGLPPTEQIVFSAIAENTKAGEVLTDTGIAEILEQAGIKVLARDISPSKLAEWKMLEKTEKGYRFYFEILRTWVEENQMLNKVKEELEKISPVAETLYQTAYSYYRQNNIELSLLRLRDALAENPNHFKARLLHGTILYERKEYLLAISELKEAYKFDENETRSLLVKTMLEYGVLLEEQGDDKSAENIYNEILQDIHKNEKNALLRKKSILIKQGDQYKANGEYILAFEIYNSVSSEEKTYELFKEMSLRAFNLESDGKIDEAENVYSILGKIDSKEQWSSKVSELRHLITFLAELEALTKQISHVLHTQGDIERAKDMLQNASILFAEIKPKISRTTVETLQDKFTKLDNLIHEIEDTSRVYEKGDVSVAAQKIHRLLEKNPGNRRILDLSKKIDETKSLITSAKSFYDKGDNTKAISFLDKVTKGNPANRDARELRSSISEIDILVKRTTDYYLSGNLESAEELVNTVIRKQPLNNEILSLQQEIQSINSTYEKAKIAFDKGDLWSAKLHIDSVLIKIPSHKKSISLRESIDELTLNIERAEAAYKSKDYIRAERYLDAALEIQSSNPKARQLVGEVEKRLSKMQQQSSWLPTAVFVGIISSCGTLLVVVWILISSPSIAELFIPKPTATFITTDPSPSAVSETGIAPTISVTEILPTTFPTTAPTSSGQLQDSNRFVFLPLSGVLKTDGSAAPNKTATDNLQLTPGYHVLAGIPIDFKYEIFTQNEGSSDYPQTLILPTNIQNPLAAYVLIQADWGYARFDGKQIGKIVFNFDNSQFEYPLIMGLNIRDWTRGVFPAAVTEITSQDIVYAWEGTAPDGRAGGMDLLKVAIPPEYQSDKLTSIEIMDTSLETTGEATAGIRILSTSIEMQDPTPGPWVYQAEQVPATDTSLIWPLNTNDTLILTGGSLQYQDYSCSGNGNQICVLVITSAKDADMTIGRLAPKNNWLAVTRTVSPDEAVNSVTSEFWLPPNCGAGCSFATVAIFSDGVLVNSYKVNNPNK